MRLPGREKARWVFNTLAKWRPSVKVSGRPTYRQVADAVVAWGRSLRPPGRGSRTPIGIDVGRRQIKAAQFGRAAGGWQIASAVVVDRIAPSVSATGEEVRGLRTALAEAGFEGTSVVLSAPLEKLLTGIMELPPADSGAPIEMLARSELARMNKCEPQEIEMSCWPLPAPARAANTTFVMGVGCRHADANALLDTFEEEGFHVQRLEPQARAVAAACSPLLSRTPGISGILDVGWTSTRMALLFQGVVVYERNLIKSGLSGLVSPLAKQLHSDADDVEELLGRRGRPPDQGGRADQKARTVEEAAGAFVDGMADEMRIPLTYLANQYPDAALDRLLLVGGGAGLCGLADRLATALDCGAHVVKPSDLGRCSEAFDEQFGPAIASAVSLGRLDGR